VLVFVSFCEKESRCGQYIYTVIDKRVVSSNCASYNDMTKQGKLPIHPSQLYTKEYTREQGSIIPLVLSYPLALLSLRYPVLSL
jgi:hypothetical protein